jgi:hypothetical protein
MRNRLLIAAALLLWFAGRASAQEAIVEGAGVALGEGTVLHPSVGVETGIDTNVFYEESGVTVAPLLRVMGSFAIASQHNEPRQGLVKPMTETDTTADEQAEAEGQNERDGAAPTLDFRLAGRMQYDQYLHTNIAVTEQSNLSGGLDAHGGLYPQGTLSVFADETLVRDTRPRNFESLGDLNRWVNQFQFGGHFRPGNGALDFSLRYENVIDYFESDASEFANRMNQLLRGRAEWQWLPITRFFFDASYGFFGPLSDGAVKPGSNPLRLQFGVASLITELTTVRAHIGFGKGFYAAGPDFTNAIFGGEFGYRYSPMGRFTVAYEYDFHDSVNANFYRDHAVVAKVDQQLSLFLLTAGAQVRLRGYRGVFPTLGGDPARDDLIVRMQGRAHYLYRDWLAFTGEVDFVSDITGYDAMGDDPSYNRFELLVGGVAAF